MSNAKKNQLKKLITKDFDYEQIRQETREDVNKESDRQVKRDVGSMKKSLP